MNCPQCNSENIATTNKFDLQSIEATEARIDFECFDCGCLFQLIYHPVEASIVTRGTLLEDCDEPENAQVCKRHGIPIDPLSGTHPYRHGTGYCSQCNVGHPTISEDRPKLAVDDIIEVHGWPMLAKLDPGQYRVSAVGKYGQSNCYSFTKPKGTKVIVRHYAHKVDGWIDTNGTNPDLNKITIVKEAKNAPKEMV